MRPRVINLLTNAASSVQILLGFSWATLYVGALKHVMEDNVETATAGGWLNRVTSLAAILGPVLGGFLAVSSYLLPMYAAAILSTVALALYVYEIVARTTSTATG